MPSFPTVANPTLPTLPSAGGSSNVVVDWFPLDFSTSHGATGSTPVLLESGVGFTDLAVSQSAPGAMTMSYTACDGNADDTANTPQIHWDPDVLFGSGWAVAGRTIQVALRFSNVVIGGTQRVGPAVGLVNTTAIGTLATASNWPAVSLYQVATGFARGYLHTIYSGGQAQSLLTDWQATDFEGAMCVLTSTLRDDPPGTPVSGLAGGQLFDSTGSAGYANAANALTSQSVANTQVFALGFIGDNVIGAGGFDFDVYVRLVEAPTLPTGWV